MKILVIGSGGREHALVWKLAQSKKVQKVYAAPGNGGTAGEEKAENLSLDGIAPESEERQERLLEFAGREKIDLTVVGPETPLAAGIVDKFRAAGIAIVGPCQKAALLESSKVYSDSFMTRYGVRTGKREKFTDLKAAIEYAGKHLGGGNEPLVIKADGLASGKGVVITSDVKEAEETLSAFMKDGKNIVFEEYIDGVEVSILAAVSADMGKAVIKPFLPARDHKRRYEGGRGPNTGGMGAIAPVPDFSPALQNDFVNAILTPTIKGMEAENMDYRGFIFFGLMVREDRCYLLEYNVRLGDPETQALLPLMDSDLTELCGAILDGTLVDFSIEWKKGAVCAPVAVAEGYPGPGRKGDPIAIDAAALGKTGARIFAAGATGGSGGLYTSGGRVLTVSAHGKDADDARTKAYEALRCVSFEGMDYRKDIGREERHG
jgi:phosphoribosylamine--glycine ligase